MPPTTETSPLRVGVVGAGPFARAHARELVRNPDVRLVGIAAPSAARRDLLAAECRARVSVATATELISAGAECLVIAAYPPAQADIAIAAVDAGVPVLVEKPVSVSADQQERLAAAVRASTGWVMPGHLLRFSAAHAEAQARLGDGEVGRVRFLAFRRHRSLDHQRLFPELHPALMTMVHDIDLALWFTGEQLHVVSAFHVRNPGSPQPTVVSAEAVTPAGVHISFQVSWSLGSEQRVSDSCEIVGDDGMISLRDDPRIVSAHGAVDDILTPAHPYGALAAEHRAFFGAVRAGAAPDQVTLADAFAGLAVARRIIELAEANS